MTTAPVTAAPPSVPTPRAVLELLKPVTWFPPMWAFACGAIAAGPGITDRIGPTALGVILAGPLICGTSQAVNDWFDRHVDAINEPDRVIPSGRMPGQWGLWIAIANTGLSLAVAAMLGSFVLVAAIIGLVFAWAYSAPPFRFKRNGWIGNGVVGLSYETLPWLTAAAAVLGHAPDGMMIAVAFAYGIGAHGIMTLNDFKAMEGDRVMGIHTLPVLHGPRGAALIACIVMLVPQVFVAGVMTKSGLSMHGLIIGGLIAAQALCMLRFVADPVRRAVWYSAIGVGLYVSGMMVAAFGLRSLAAISVPV